MAEQSLGIHAVVENQPKGLVRLEITDCDFKAAG